MSLTAAIARIDQIVSFEQQVLPAPAAPAAGSFASTLARASASRAPDAGGPESPDWRAYRPLVDAAARRYDVPAALIDAVIQQESGFDPNATSAAGAQGLMQLMPATAAGLGATDAYDPAQNIAAGAHYLREQLDTFGGNVSLALAAYNAGAGAVQRYGGIPPYPQTQAYVPAVLAHYRQFQSLLANDPGSPA
jgi:soluble lytic murein transglycosylase-like protein